MIGLFHNRCSCRSVRFRRVRRFGTVIASGIAYNEQFYGLQLQADKDATLDEMLRKRLDEKDIKLGAVLICDQITLHIREISSSGSIEYVGMTIRPASEASSHLS